MLIYIRSRREARRMTQAELGERLGVGQSAIAQWESGAKNPTADKLPLLAEALGCGVGELYSAPNDLTIEEAG